MSAAVGPRVPRSLIRLTEIAHLAHQCAVDTASRSERLRRALTRHAIGDLFFPNEHGADPTMYLKGRSAFHRHMSNHVPRTSP